MGTDLEPQERFVLKFALEVGPIRWGLLNAKTRVKMKHSQNSPTANMHAILECIFIDYANQLRAAYPGRKIRNAAVFASAIPEFERFGYIELVDTRNGVRKGIPKCLIDRIKRSKRQPSWIPSRNFPVDLSNIVREMTPSIRGDAVVWRHTPTECRRVGQQKLDRT